MVFNRNGQLLEYKAPQQAKGECRLDQEWLNKLIAERAAALAREQSGVQISTDVGEPQVRSGATVGEVDSADRSSISANVENQLLGGGATVAKVGSNPTVSSSISADVVEPQGRSGAIVEGVNTTVTSSISPNVVERQGRSGANVEELDSNPTVSANKVKDTAKPLSERVIFKKQMQKAQREQDTALLKRVNTTNVQNVEGEQGARNEMVKSIKERQKIEEIKEKILARKIQKKFRALKRFKDSATVVEGGNTHTPDPSPKVVTNTDKVQVKE